MKLDTPLDEVASHLPTLAAQILDRAPMQVQTHVLIQIRSCLVFWETQRYMFDPIALEGILVAFVASYTPLLQEISRLRTVNGALSERLNLADTLIERMSIELTAGGEHVDTPCGT